MPITMRAVVVAALLLLAAGGAAYAGLSSEKEGPAREEVTSFAADENIGEGEAARRLAAQARLPRLADEASRALGRDYGGVWVDERIKLGVRSPDAQLTAKAREAIARAGLEGEADVVAGARSEAEIVGLQHRIERELVAVNAGAEITIDAQPNLEAGVVEVLTPPRRRDRSPAQAAWLERAPERFGSSIRIMRGPGKLELW